MRHESRFRRLPRLRYSLAVFGLAAGLAVLAVLVGALIAALLPLPGRSRRPVPDDPDA